jgi:methionyl-tRNA formyltransferase
LFDLHAVYILRRRTCDRQLRNLPQMSTAQHEPRRTDHGGDRCALATIRPDSNEPDNRISKKESTMPDPGESPTGDRWRVVVLTNIQGGVVYHLAASVLQPLGHRIVGVVTTPGPKRIYDPAYLDVVANISPEVEVLVTSRPSKLAAVLRQWDVDLILVGGFPWRLPVDVLELPRLGVINLHPALLPRNRGRYAFEWAFRNEEAETGFTVHRMAPEFDTGAILAQVVVPIEDDDDVISLIEKMGPPLPGLLTSALERIARGEKGEPQDESLATDTPAFEPEWRTIDWSRPVRTVHNQVRSWTGQRTMPGGAFGDVDGERLLILRTRLGDADGHASGNAPGTVVAREDDSIVIQCGDGPLRIVKWEAAGD